MFTLFLLTTTKSCRSNPDSAQFGVAVIASRRVHSVCENREVESRLGARHRRRQLVNRARLVLPHEELRRVKRVAVVGPGVVQLSEALAVADGAALGLVHVALQATVVV